MAPRQNPPAVVTWENQDTLKAPAPPKAGRPAPTPSATLRTGAPPPPVAPGSPRDPVRPGATITPDAPAAPTAELPGVAPAEAAPAPAQPAAQAPAAVGAAGPTDFVSFAKYLGLNSQGAQRAATAGVGDEATFAKQEQDALATARGQVDASTPVEKTAGYSQYLAVKQREDAAHAATTGQGGALGVSASPYEEALRSIYRQGVNSAYGANQQQADTAVSGAHDWQSVLAARTGSQEALPASVASNTTAYSAPPAPKVYDDPLNPSPEDQALAQLAG